MLYTVILDTSVSSENIHSNNPNFCPHHIQYIPRTLALFSSPTWLLHLLSLPPIFLNVYKRENKEQCPVHCIWKPLRRRRRRIVDMQTDTCRQWPLKELHRGLHRRLQSKRPLFLAFLSPFTLNNTYIRFRDSEKRETSWRRKIQKTAHTPLWIRDETWCGKEKKLQCTANIVRAPPLAQNSYTRLFSLSLSLFLTVFFFTLISFRFIQWYISLYAEGKTNNPIEIYHVTRPTKCSYLVSAPIWSSNSSILKQLDVKRMIHYLWLNTNSKKRKQKKRIAGMTSYLRHQIGIIYEAIISHSSTLVNY